MKKTKHFNISVPELGDVPDITQVSNAISDLEDATAGTLEIMKAEMQGTKITLTSVSRKTKRTGYYEGMSIRFKSPQDIEPNYLKTISVDGLGDQTLSVEYKVNRNEYIDIVYEGNKFTAYPVVVQKTDSVSENSSILVGTAKGVKTAYDKGVEALNKANHAQSTADGKVSKGGDKMTGPLTIDAYSNNLKLLSRGVNKGELIAIEDSIALYNTATQTMLRMYDNGNISIPAKNLTTASKEIVGSINELNYGKVSKSGDTMTGGITFENVGFPLVLNYKKSTLGGGGFSRGIDISIEGETKAKFGLNGYIGEPETIYIGKNYKDRILELGYDGSTSLKANNLSTQSKEVVSAINELNSGKVSKGGDTITGKLIVKSDINIVKNGTSEPGLIVYDESSNPKTSLFTASDSSTVVKNYDSGNYLKLGSNGNSYLKANNLKTKEKEVVGAVNEMYDSAFISGDRVKYVNTESIDWNAQSGIYKAEQPGATYTMAHFYSGNGSTPAFDLLGRYDEILQYRTTRDNNGYSKWYTVATTKYCQEGYVSDIRFGASVYRAVFNGPAFREQSGYVITELINHNSDQYIDTLRARPLQKKKNDMWLTVSFEE